MKLSAKVFFLVLIWTTISTIILHAQKISLKDINLNFSLQDYRLEDIIDGTPDTDIIGYVYKGLVNSSLRRVYFDDSVTEEFENLFKPIFSESKDAIPIVIRINSIQVNEWSEVFSKKINLISLSLSIFQQVENNRYVLIADRVVNNYDVDGLKFENIGQRIGQAVDRAFDYLDLYLDANRPGLSWSELWEYQAFQGLPFPRISNDLKLFEHYSDFRQNKVLESMSAVLVETPTGLVLLDESGNHPKGIWGYSSKGVLYINGGNRFLGVNPKNQGFVYMAVSNNQDDDEDRSPTFLNVHKIKSLLSPTDKENRYEIPLNSLTGFLDIMPIYELSAAKDRSALGEKTIIEFAPFGRPDDVLDIRIDDNLMIQLSKGEFFEVPTYFKAKNLQACIESKCQAISIDASPMHRVVFKKGNISQEPFTEKEKLRYLRNVDLKYWVIF